MPSSMICWNDGLVVLVDEALLAHALVQRREQPARRCGREQLDADRLAHRRAHRDVLADREHAVLVVGGDLDLLETDLADRADREAVGAALDELLDHAEVEHDVAVEQDEAVVLDVRAASAAASTRCSSTRKSGFVTNVTSRLGNQLATASRTMCSR